MPTRAEIERLATTNSDIATLAIAEVEALWRSLDTTDPMAVRAALEELLPAIVGVYGELSATAAADAYDLLREASGTSGRFTAVLAAPVVAEAVRANARWAIGPLFSANPQPDQALGRLAGEVDRMALQPGRETISLSAARDPADVRWARVPSGPEPCAFCRTLASRGAVYATEATAGGLDPDSYHGDCNCVATPIWDDQPYPDGYDPDAYYAEYRAAVDAAPPGADAKRVLSEMRRQLAIH